MLPASQGFSTDPAILSQLREAAAAVTAHRAGKEAAGTGGVLVLLDSDHSSDNVQVSYNDNDNDKVQVSYNEIAVALPGRAACMELDML